MKIVFLDFDGVLVTWDSLLDDDDDIYPVFLNNYVKTDMYDGLTDELANESIKILTYNIYK